MEKAFAFAFAQKWEYGRLYKDTEIRRQDRVYETRKVSVADVHRKIGCTTPGRFNFLHFQEKLAK